jgi:hypothetical protein
MLKQKTRRKAGFLLPVLFKRLIIKKSNIESNMKRIALILLFFVPIASATEIYKCEMGNSSVVQSQPCAAGSRTVWQRTYSEPTRPRSTNTTNAPYRTQTTNSTNRTWTNGNQNQSATVNRCTEARNREAAYREQRGLNITFDELRQLGDMVKAACG